LSIDLQAKGNEDYHKLLEWEEWNKAQEMELSRLKSSEANLQKTLSAERAKLQRSEEARASLASDLNKATESNQKKEEKIASLQDECRLAQGDKHKLERHKSHLELQLNESKRSASDWKEKAESFERYGKRTQSQLQESKRITADVEVIHVMFYYIYLSAISCNNVVSC
jgi:chromosome segregation ATPase